MDRPDPEPIEGFDREASLSEESPKAGGKDRKMNIAQHPSRLEEQRPVSWIGWLIALVAGAALWVLIFRWLGG